MEQAGSDVDALVSALHDWKTRRGAAEQLALIGSPAVKPLIAALDNPSWQVSQTAADIIVRIGPPAVTELVAAVLTQSGATGPFSSATQVLGRLGDLRAVPELLTALSHEDPLVRAAAAEALGSVVDKGSIPSLVASLGDPDSSVRAAGAKALGAIGDPQAVPPLITAALRDASLWEATGESLCAINDPQSVDLLADALTEEDAQVRVAAATMLGATGDPQAVQALATALGDENASVRTAAAESLGSIGDPKAIPSLRAARGDADDWVRRAATAALDELDPVWRQKRVESDASPPADRQDLEDFFAVNGPTLDLDGGVDLAYRAAQIALHTIQDQLPQWGGGKAFGTTLLGRPGFPPPRETLALDPQFLLMINWANSGPGYSWPEAYYATYIPGYDRFLVTASQDSTDMWGVTDEAIGSFPGNEDISSGSGRVITNWWRWLADQGQDRWDYLFQPGLIDDDEANHLADQAWPQRSEAYGDEEAPGAAHSP